MFIASNLIILLLFNSCVQWLCLHLRLLYSLNIAFIVLTPPSPSTLLGSLSVSCSPGLYPSWLPPSCSLAFTLLGSSGHRLFISAFMLALKIICNNMISKSPRSPSFALQLSVSLSLSVSRLFPSVSPSPRLPPSHRLPLTLLLSPSLSWAPSFSRPLSLLAPTFSLPCLHSPRLLRSLVIYFSIYACFEDRRSSAMTRSPSLLCPLPVSLSPGLLPSPSLPGLPLPPSFALALSPSFPLPLSQPPFLRLPPFPPLLWPSSRQFLKMLPSSPTPNHIPLLAPDTLEASHLASTSPAPLVSSSPGLPPSPLSPSLSFPSLLATLFQPPFSPGLLSQPPSLILSLPPLPPSLSASLILPSVAKTQLTAS
jgi:hypothetical protein